MLEMRENEIAQRKLSGCAQLRSLEGTNTISVRVQREVKRGAFKPGLATDPGSTPTIFCVFFEAGS